MKNITGSLKHILLFGAIFAFMGAVIPKVYYQYLDNKNYIEYQGNVTFDKKEYRACETQTAQSIFNILIDSPIVVESRLYLQREEENKNEIIKEYRFESFLKSELEPQIHIVKADLPCGLEPGTYFYRGILIYHIRGIKKVSSFASEQFTIIE